MPSSKYKTLTVGSYGTSYTAPANGWVTIFTNNITNSNGANIRLYNSTSGYGVQDYNQQGGQINIILPIIKGDIFKLYYWSISTSEVMQFRFYYAEGAQ